MVISTAVANNMLKNVSDPELRRLYGDIISGKFSYSIFCLNPGSFQDQKTGKMKKYHADKCLIGMITPDGRVADNMTLNKDGVPIAGCESSRDRLDGRKGFKCYCGNNSIIAPEEQGVIAAQRVPTAPTKQDLMTILEKVQESGKGQLEFVGGWVEYDGFGLMEAES